MHTRISLRACCMHARHHAHNLSSLDWYSKSQSKVPVFANANFNNVSMGEVKADISPSEVTNTTMSFLFHGAIPGYNMLPAQLSQKNNLPCLMPKIQQYFFPTWLESWQDPKNMLHKCYHRPQIPLLNSQDHKTNLRSLPLSRNLFSKRNVEISSLREITMRYELVRSVVKTT